MSLITKARSTALSPLAKLWFTQLPGRSARLYKMPVVGPGELYTVDCRGPILRIDAAAYDTAKLASPLTMPARVRLYCAINVLICNSIG